MTNSTYTQAKELQQLAGRFLCEEVAIPYTDVEEWMEVQEHLTTCIEGLLTQEGNTPDEEGEIVLAVLMGYAIAVRKRRNIARAMERANRVLSEIRNPVLRCRLAIFCYGECYDEDLGNLARRLIEEQRTTGNERVVDELEAMLLNIEEKAFA